MGDGERNLPLVVTVQYCLAGRGLSAAGAWAVVCALVVPVFFFSSWQPVCADCQGPRRVL